MADRLFARPWDTAGQADIALHGPDAGRREYVETFAVVRYFSCTLTRAEAAMHEQTQEIAPEQDQLAELSEAARLDPGNAQLQYWLGVQLAQVGRYEQASAEIGTALALQPDLHVARFQLGLLHLAMTEITQAGQVWAPLEQLEDEHALKHFKHGLEALIRDDFTACIDHLERGIALNTINIPLSKDMGLVRDQARNALAQQNGATPTMQTEESRDGMRTDFSLYNTLN